MALSGGRQPESGPARARMRTAWVSKKPTVPMRRCSPIPTSTRFITRCPTTGTRPWSIAAAHAHKPTLVEKPMALNAAQAQQIVDVFQAEKVLLAEAFMYRYHPQHARVRQLLADGRIGPMNLIDVCFTYSLPPSDTENVRLKPQLGGGGLLDVGCYCVNLCRMMVGQEPDSVTGQAMIGADSGVDEFFVGTLHFPGGVLAHLDCGMRSRLPPPVHAGSARTA